MNEKDSIAPVTYKGILNRLHQICVVKNLKDGMLAGHVCRILSPYCSAFFIKRDVSPNTVTLFMIMFGIVGSILFALPICWTKLVGYFFWYLWFTMDLSDGEVARYTSKFSKYGTEMDYMAHLIDHPLMNIAIWLTFLQFNLINPFLISLIFIVVISMELVIRSITAFNHYYSKTTSSTASSSPKSLPRYLIAQVVLYPNFIILFTPLIVIDYFMQIGWSFYLFLIWVALDIFMFIRTVILKLREYYKG